jgi:hypothetical protein
MAKRNRKRRRCHVESERSKLANSDGLPFQELLSRKQIAEALVAAGIVFRERIYTPFVTLWAFLSQVMSTTHGSCQDAVARVSADRVVRGKSRCSADSSSYCEARQKLSEAVIRQLARDIGYGLHNQASDDWLWFGRPVKLVDGSTLSLADTPENQAEYPQSSGQKAGLGFPLMRIVVVLSLAVGTVLECAMSACRGKGTGELTLFRQLWELLNDKDIVLADRLYDSYRDIALLKARGVDCVFGKKQSRKVDFRRGMKISADDHVVEWRKPRYNASRFESYEEWQSLPDTLLMRELRLLISGNGFRTRTIMIVTTLLDAELHSAEDLFELFAQRWNCEIDLRSIKQSMGMHRLKCQTPEMARKELWTYLLGYNLIRVRMAQAALLHDCPPRMLSFKGTQTQLEHFTLRMELAADPAVRDRLERAMLAAISECPVGNRPGRQEPRAVKRRKQKYSYLTKPRTQARQQLAA